MTAAVHDRAAGKRAPKIAWMRLSGHALSVALCTGIVASGALFVALSF